MALGNKAADLLGIDSYSATRYAVRITSRDAAVSDGYGFARMLAQLHLKLYTDPMSAPTDMFAILYPLGVRVKAIRLTDDPCYPGCAFHSPYGFRLIILNALQRPARRHFTLAHELAHIVFKHPTERSVHNERVADIYSSELLMPEQRVRHQHEVYMDAHTLASVNCVSVSAMQRRLIELHLV